VKVKPRSHKKLWLTLVVLIVASISAFPALAANPPVVHAVLFYSPSCPHCHEVITNVLPPLAQKYGDQLQILGVDVTQEAGLTLYRSAVSYFNIPDDRLGVPTLVVGNDVLVGSAEIPEIFPSLIETGLQAGGTNWPDIPGLKEALVAQFGVSEATATAEISAETSMDTSTQPFTDTSTKPNFIQNFSRDPLANSIATVVLLGMVASLVGVGYSFLNGSESKLLLWPKWVLPTLALIGLGAAIYMSYVEITKSEAVCGPVGDCNTVQESQYAYLFGVIPVGVVGIAGYLAIFIAWLLNEYGPESLRKFSIVSIWGMGWFGVLFSIYLTFLEPFVIGATCAWCITSAIVMTLILLASTESAKKTLQSDNLELDDDEDFGDDEGDGNPVDDNDDLALESEQGTL
jgi:uncharacterized membrane protein